MYKLAENLGEKIAEAIKADQDQKEVIIYGLLAIIQFVFVMILILVFSSLLGTLYASLILSFSVSILRINAGGAHLSSIWICSLTGVVISVLMPTVFKLIGVQNADPVFVYVLTDILLLLALWVVIAKAPVDSPNKPITKPEKIKKLKRRSIIVVCIYIIVGNLLAYKGLYIHLFCLLFGTAWQAFTMLKAGHIVLGFLEKTLTKRQ
ncbi:MAG: accessory gene regulator ArgB-like protein [Clostridia bacterium]|jgi:accessory gene regulator B|nr:accessory gene regulator B family protein [Clostridiaceae bacterium]